MPDPLKTVVIRVSTASWVLPGMTATRQPSRAAVVSNCATIPSRADSNPPMIHVINIGATIAISTALVPFDLDRRGL
jgi:hypothetical protein